MNDAADAGAGVVLYLDDEEPLVFLVSHMLQRLGHGSPSSPATSLQPT